MSSALSDRTIDLVKATVPALEGRGTAVTDRMYQLLFKNQDKREAGAIDLAWSAEGAMSEEGWAEISVRVGNAIYKGQCRVDRNEVVVRRADATRSAPLGSKPIKLIAEMLLRELVAEAKT